MANLIEKASTGILPKYNVARADGAPIEKSADFFVLRIDEGGSDPKHIDACRKAAEYYTKAIAKKGLTMVDYVITKTNGTAVDPDATYVVLPLNEEAENGKVWKIGRKAILAYGRAIERHLPGLAEDIDQRYNPKAWRPYRDGR